MAHEAYSRSRAYRLVQAKRWVVATETLLKPFVNTMVEVKPNFELDEACVRSGTGIRLSEIKDIQGSHALSNKFKIVGAAVSGGVAGSKGGASCYYVTLEPLTTDPVTLQQGVAVAEVYDESTQAARA